MGLEDRFDRLEARMQEKALEDRKHQGEVIARLENMENYIGAVSRKADSIRESLDGHKESPEAHGAGAAQKMWARLLQAVTISISVAALVAGLMRRHG